jgi:cyclic pyranopterin phosphate synthase
MNDITHKSVSLREATARAIVSVGSPQTISAIREGQVPKGDIFQMARVAAMLGVKKTADLIPDCHPLPIEGFSFTGNIEDQEIILDVYVKTIYKTGVEVEAMHGASVAALTVYDMLKPLDKQVHIRSIALLEKKGGKSDRTVVPPANAKARVVVCSDGIAAGQRTDASGKLVAEKIQALGLSSVDLEVIADEPKDIESAVYRAEKEGITWLVFTGGTGLGPRDVTPETLRPLLDREIPGVMENARRYGQERMPFAMLSRGLAGVRNHMLILSLPGSKRGAAETMEAITPAVLHVFNMMAGGGHGG